MRDKRLRRTIKYLDFLAYLESCTSSWNYLLYTGQKWKLSTEHGYLFFSFLHNFDIFAKKERYITNFTNSKFIN